MQIGVLTTGYPHRGDIVAGAFVREHARALASRGHRVRVLCAEKPGDAPCVDSGIDVHPVRYGLSPAFERTFYGAGAPEALGQFEARAWLGALSFPPTLAWRLHRTWTTCDAWISHFVVPCGLAAAWAGRDRRPHVAIAHGTDAWMFAKLPRAVQRFVVSRPLRVQFTHAAALARCAPDVRNDPRCVVAPMGFFRRTEGLERGNAAPERAARRGSRASARERWDVKGFLIVSVARLVPVKGLDVLVDAVSAVARSGIEVRALVAGDGPERAALERRIRALDAPVTLLGALDREACDALLDAADVFALSSRVLASGRSEGAPASVVEAMGRALPCVVTRVGGLAQLVGDAGITVEPDDAVALADALGSLALDPRRCHELGSRAVSRAAPWAWDAQCAELERVLRAGAR